MAGNSASSAALAHAPGCTGAALYLGQRKHGQCASCLSLLAPRSTCFGHQVLSRALGYYLQGTLSVDRGSAALTGDTAFAKASR